MTNIEKKTFQTPDETSHPAKNVTMETLKIGDLAIIKVTVAPGWVWSKHLKPVQKTDSCQKHHLLYMISGRIGAKMNDGTDLEFGPGEVGNIPPGHDGWTIGDEDAVWLELPH